GLERKDAVPGPDHIIRRQFAPPEALHSLTELEGDGEGVRSGLPALRQKGFRSRCDVRLADAVDLLHRKLDETIVGRHVAFQVLPESGDVLRVERCRRRGDGYREPLGAAASRALSPGAASSEY